MNEADSHSGYGVVLATLAERGVPEEGFAEVVETGSHAASVRAVREGRVDAAAVDSHLLAAFVADDPALLGELTRSDTLGPSPAQPLVAGPGPGPGRAAGRAGGAARGGRHRAGARRDDGGLGAGDRRRLRPDPPDARRGRARCGSESR